MATTHLCCTGPHRLHPEAMLLIAVPQKQACSWEAVAPEGTLAQGLHIGLKQLELPGPEDLPTCLLFSSFSQGSPCVPSGSSPFSSSTLQWSPHKSLACPILSWQLLLRRPCVWGQWCRPTLGSAVWTYAGNCRLKHRDTTTRPSGWSQPRY